MDELITKVLDTIDRNVYQETIDHNMFDSSLEWVVNIDNLKSQITHILKNYKPDTNCDPDNTHEHPHNMQHD